MRKELLLPDITNDTIFEHVHAFTIPRSPFPELHESRSIEEVFPYIGTLIREAGGDCSVTETQDKLSKVTSTVTCLVSGTGSGKSTGVIKLAFDRILEARVKQERGMEHVPLKGCVYLVPTNSLARDQHAYAEYLSRTFTGESITCGLYASSLGDEERVEMRKNPPDLLFMTYDMYYRSLAGSRKFTPWVRRLVEPSLLFVDEMDNGSGITAAHVMVMLLSVVDHNRKVNSKVPSGNFPPFQLITGSATIPNAREVYLPLFGDGTAIIREEAIHGDIHFTVFDASMNGMDNRKRKRKEGLKQLQVKRWELFIDRLLHLKAYRNVRTLVFIDNRHVIELLAKRYKNRKDIVYYHSKRKSTDKKNALERFNSGSARMMFTTSALESGLNIADLQRVIITGLPRERRQLIQRYARVARHRDTVGHVYIFLDSLVPREREVLDKLEGQMESYLFPQPEKLIVNLENDQIARFSILFGTILGLRSLDRYRHYHGKKRVTRVLNRLVTAGKIVYHGKRLHVTDFTGDALCKHPVRAVEESFKIVVDKGDGTEGVISSMDPKEQMKHAQVGQVFPREGRTWQVKEIIERKIVVEEVSNGRAFLADNSVATVVNGVEEITKSENGLFSLVKVTLEERVLQKKEMLPRGIDHVEEEPLEKSDREARVIHTTGIRCNIPFHGNKTARLFGELFLHEANRKGLVSKKDMTARVVVEDMDEFDEAYFRKHGNQFSLVHDTAAGTNVSHALHGEVKALFVSTRELIAGCTNDQLKLRDLLETDLRDVAYLFRKETTTNNLGKGTIDPGLLLSLQSRLDSMVRGASQGAA